MDVHPLLLELLGRHCFFLRHEALAAGVSDKVLRRWRRDGVLHRIRHGAYTLRSHWRSLDVDGRHLLRARCVVRTAGVDVALSHASAAVAFGAPTWGLPLDDVHLVRLDGRSGRREAGVRQHRHAVRPDDVVYVNDLPVCSAQQTCLDVMTIAGVEVAICVIDHLLHRGAVSMDELTSRSDELVRRPGSLSSGLTLLLVDGRSESVGESRLRYRCWRDGLPRPVPQYEVVRGGRVRYRLDLAWPAYGVWVEFDGREKYVKHLRDGETVVDCVLREKRREEQIALQTGWRCIRVTWADLQDRERLVARIAAVLAGGPVFA